MTDGPRRYRTKPAQIEAMQWQGDNLDALADWTGGMFALGEDDGVGWLYVAANSSSLPLAVGEWVAQDVLGFYPIQDSVFQQKYEPVEEPSDG